MSLRMVSNVNTVIDGRRWRAGQPAPVSDDEVDSLIPHVQAGILVVVPDADPEPWPDAAEDGEIIEALPEATDPRLVRGPL